MDVSGYAFITGGGSGIGRASCIAFAKEGAKGVIVADINLEAAKDAANEAKAVAIDPGFRAEEIQVDVTDEDSVKSAIDRTIALFGRIDYVIHCAGIPVGAWEPIATASFQDFKRVSEVNVNGTFLVTSLASAAMIAQEPQQVSATEPERGTTRGTIVNLASVAAFMTGAGMVQYTSSKHAVLAITKTAAIDNAEHKIRVNCVCPGWVDTPMCERLKEVIPPLNHVLIPSIPMGRLAKPKEVADTILYLCSSRSSFTTGSAVVMDGGMRLKL